MDCNQVSKAVITEPLTITMWQDLWTSLTLLREVMIGFLEGKGPENILFAQVADINERHQRAPLFSVFLVEFSQWKEPSDQNTGE